MTTSWYRIAVVYGALALVSSGCAVPLYPGPRRERAEVARLDAQDAVIDEVDGIPLRGQGRELEILPGPHALIVRHPSQPPGTRGLAVCFTARAGQEYTAIADVDGAGGWRPQIIDRYERYPIRVRRAAPGTPACLNEEPVKAIELPAAPAIASMPDGGSDAGVSQQEAPDAALPADVAPEPNLETPQPRVAQATDDEPAPRQRTRPFVLAPEVEVPIKHAGTGLSLELGILFGGDKLVEAEFSDGDTAELTAGGGVLLAVGGMWTSWSTPNVGVGGGLTIGWKGQTIEASNASVKFWRFPVTALAHVMLLLDEHWALLLRAGLFTELASELSGSGDAEGSVDLNAGLGQIVETDLLFTRTTRAAIGFGFRYARINYSVADESVDGTGFGLILLSNFLF